MDAANPSDRYCIPSPEPFSRELTNDQLRAHFRHYMLCDWNPELMMPYLDELVLRGDVEATTDKGILLLPTDRAGAVELLARSAAMGDLRARRTLGTLRDDP